MRGPSKPKLAPKVKPPSRKKPNVMRENSKAMTRKKTAMWPLKTKRLSK